MLEKQSFESTMASYREDIDFRINGFIQELIQDTEQGVGTQNAEILEYFGEFLSRGGKRIRGALTINAYEMCGGQDKEMILEAACAIEVMHAYILAFDDIQDRSLTRRGGPTLHQALKTHIDQKRWRGDADHNSESLAALDALIGSHASGRMFGRLKHDSDVLLKVRDYVDTTMILTAQGQIGDIINEINGEVTEEDIEAVISRKTSYYTILNPIQIGMMLAGAPQEDLERVVTYSKELGRAFQITDDALTYSEQTIDKDMSVDIRDGKITLIILDAIKSVSDDSRQVLKKYLGKSDLTSKEYEECVRVVRESGAVQRAMDSAWRSSEIAIEETRGFPKHWNQQNIEFMRDLARYLISRTS